MIALKIAVLVVAGIVLLTLVKRDAPVFAVLGEIALVLIVVLTILPEIEKMLVLFENFQNFSSVSQVSLKIMFKTFVILATGAVVADICRDNGENTVAGVVELSVKILAISCALPVFTAVIEIASTFFNR